MPTIGIPSRAATEAALKPTTTGEARWITWGAKLVMMRAMVCDGVVTTRTTS